MSKHTIWTFNIVKKKTKIRQTKARIEKERARLNMTAEEKAFTKTSAETYAAVGEVHAEECGKGFEEIEHDKAARRMALERDPDYDSHLGVRRGDVKVQIP